LTLQSDSKRACRLSHDKNHNKVDLRQVREIRLTRFRNIVYIETMNSKRTASIAAQASRKQALLVKASALMLLSLLTLLLLK
jgi:hypothetical protein